MQIKHLTYQFPKQTTPFFNDLSFNLAVPSVNFLIGTNGAGKTTLADLLTGLRSPSTPVTLPKSTLYLSQRLPMLTSIKVQDVAELILGVEYGRTKLTLAQVKSLVDPATYAVIEPLWNQVYGQLSGGQQRLVQLLLFLQCQRELIVLDEPTAEIDRQNVNRLCTVLREHPDRTYLIITHDYRDLTQFKDYQVLWLDQRRVTTFSPVEFAKASQPFIRDFKQH
ncbi:ABC transporter ATP-binding protein [Lactiplantibacillus plajomi]|uniref:ATP-binding cassette domain-containing protein n=1 Tax=Lactiplantibacillus plajomi TaxID=1457217 RepID=A0ABV6K4I4_9LACO|nr:ATP-binding cassette domain-containing protein [Lactiplantibacillus plajomi]